MLDANGAGESVAGSQASRVVCIKSQIKRRLDQRLARDKRVIVEVALCRGRGARKTVILQRAASRLNDGPGSAGTCASPIILELTIKGSIDRRIEAVTEVYG